MPSRGVQDQRPTSASVQSLEEAKRATLGLARGLGRRSRTVNVGQAPNILARCCHRVPSDPVEAPRIVASDPDVR